MRSQAGCEGLGAKGWVLRSLGKLPWRPLRGFHVQGAGCAPEPSAAWIGSYFFIFFRPNGKSWSGKKKLSSALASACPPFAPSVSASAPSLFSALLFRTPTAARTHHTDAEAHCFSYQRTCVAHVRITSHSRRTSGKTTRCQMPTMQASVKRNESLAFAVSQKIQVGVHL